MEIHRAKFLLLASALAASACTIKEDKDNGDASAGGSSTGGASGSTGGSKGSGGSKADASTDGGVVSDAGDAGKVTDGSVDAAHAEGGALDGGDGGGCDDSKGTPGDCSKLNPADSCSPFEFQADTCNAASTILKPGVAAAFVDCMLAETRDELCDSTNTYACKDKVIKAACPDSTADTWCTDIVDMCPSVTLASCRTYLSGLTSDGRDSMYSCLESDCTYGLYSCAEGL